MRLPNDFPVQQSAGFEPGVRLAGTKAGDCLLADPGGHDSGCLAAGEIVPGCSFLLFILGLAATMATACLGQELTPLPGPPGVGSGPGSRRRRTSSPALARRLLPPVPGFRCP